MFHREGVCRQLDELGCAAAAGAGGRADGPAGRQRPLVCLGRDVLGRTCFCGGAGRARDTVMQATESIARGEQEHSLQPVAPVRIAACTDMGVRVCSRPGSRAAAGAIHDTCHAQSRSLGARLFKQRSRRRRGTPTVCMHSMVHCSTGEPAPDRGDSLLLRGAKVHWPCKSCSSLQGAGNPQCLRWARSFPTYKRYT